MEDLFREFWWLMFPVFGMAIAVAEFLRDERRTDRIIAQARRGLEDR